MNRRLLVPVLGLLTLAVAAPACAQSRRPVTRPSYGYGADVQRIAYERGYRDGLQEGEKDGRRGEPFRFQDERDFHRADAGYHRSYGDINRYRAVFREGFTEGYEDGYRRYGPRGRYPSNGRYDPYGDQGYGYPDRGRYGYPDRGGYGYPQGSRDRYLSPYDIGARDGFEKGREDARDRDRFDPRGHKWYREGDRDYDNRYGSRDRYKEEYRRGFIAGYERGYYGR